MIIDHAIIDRLVQYLAGAAPSEERSSTALDVSRRLGTDGPHTNELLAEAGAQGIVVPDESSPTHWMLTPKGRKQAYGFAAAPLSPMPADAAEELPWTDAHQREALRRCREIEAELTSVGVDFYPHLAPGNVLTVRHFRATLAGHARLDLARIEREVTIVRQRAERAERPATKGGDIDADTIEGRGDDAPGIDEIHRCADALERVLDDYDSTAAGEAIGVLRALAQHCERRPKVPGAAADEAAQRMRAELDGMRPLLADLRDIATGKIEHLYAGSCPDMSIDPPFVGSNTVRADGCPACDVLRRADALLDDEAAADEEPAAPPSPPSWTQRALERLMADPDAIARFNAARLSPEAADLIAACRRRDGSGLDELKACLLAWKDDAERLDLVAVAPTWTPPPGVAVDVLRGSLAGPLLITLLTLDPGAEVPREVHAEHRETMVGVEGSAVVRLFDDVRFEYSCCPASVLDDGTVNVPPGVAHTIRNASADEPATYISILRRVPPTEEAV